jgi:alpha-glucosidase
LKGFFNSVHPRHGDFKLVALPLKMKPIQSEIMKIKSSLLAGVSVLAACAWLSSGCASNETASSRTPTATAPAPIAAPAAASAKVALKFVKADSEETASEDGKGANAVDGDPNTFWHTQYQDATPECPHEIIIELTPPSTIKGFTYLPRQDDTENGTIKDYEFYVSDDGKDFGQAVSKGTFESGKEKKTVTFQAKKCRFIKLKALSEINDGAWTSAAEIGVVPND